MPRPLTKLTVIASSPSDLSEERECLQEVVDELNRVWSDTFGIHLKLWRWETNTHPAAGSDAQAVVNQQMPDDYDIFIGMLWTRFGTPTPRADSGTEEEFKRAYERHASDPKSTAIMFFFKDAPIAPSKIDPIQMKQVAEFRDTLNEKGVYYRKFATSEELKSLVRLGLTEEIKKWSALPTRSVATRTDTPAAQPTELQDTAGMDTVERIEDEGFLDLVEASNAHWQKATGALYQIKKAIKELGEGFSKHTQKLQSLSADGRQPDIAAMKRSTAEAASDLDNYVARVEVEIAILEEHNSAAVEDLTKAAALSLDFGPTSIGGLFEARDSLSSALEAVGKALPKIESFRSTLAGMPRASTAFNRARRRAVTVQDRLITHLESFMSVLGESESALTRMISENQDEEND